MKYAAFNHRTELAPNKLTAFAYHNLYMIFFSALLSCFLISCSKEEYEMSGNAGGTHTIPMYFNGELSSYDGLSTRAAKTIADGTTLYLKLLSGTDTISGTAVYHSSYDDWSFTYTGNLSKGTSLCSAFYVENPVKVDTQKMILNKNSVFYSCLNGSYTYDNAKGITVTANLTPKLNRLRFRGAIGTALSFSGVYFADTISYFVNDCKYSFDEGAANDNILLTVSADGYTPVLYYEWTSNDALKVAVDSIYYRPNPLSSSPIGSSLIVDIPTKDNHSGWTIIPRQDHGNITIDDYEDWEDYSPNGHEAVDLGLSVKWATMNVGATSPEDYGDYFAWGETTGYNSGKTTFNWSTYKYCNGSNETMTKYCTDSSYGIVDNKTVLESSDDAATANWGGRWRMPTDEEFTELNESCTWTWTILSGVKGYKVTSKINGNFIFLPATGWYISSEFCEAGYSGFYWSSSLDTIDSKCACSWCFSLNYVGSGPTRCYGQSVRPVCK